MDIISPRPFFPYSLPLSCVLRKSDKWRLVGVLKPLSIGLEGFLDLSLSKSSLPAHCYHMLALFGKCDWHIYQSPDIPPDAHDRMLATSKEE
jgi:hypothetical protein